MYYFLSGRSGQRNCLGCLQSAAKGGKVMKERFSILSVLQGVMDRNPAAPLTGSEFVFAVEEVRALFDRVHIGMAEVWGRDEFGALKASPEHYERLAEEIICFCELHPSDAKVILTAVLQFVESSPATRENFSAAKAFPR